MPGCKGRGPMPEGLEGHILRRRLQKKEQWTTLEIPPLTLEILGTNALY